MNNPLRKLRRLADWLDEYNAKREERKLREFYTPRIAVAEKEKNWDERDSLLNEWSFESDTVSDPIYAVKTERLTAQARKYGIGVPHKPHSQEEDSPWYRSNATGDWLLTNQVEDQLRREIRIERRASYEEFRKWVTLVFAFAGFALGFYSVWLKQKQQDPCPRNYYRADTGECVFALQRTGIAQPAPGAQPPPETPPHSHIPEPHPQGVR